MEEIEFKFSVDWTQADFFCGLDVHKYEVAATIYSVDESYKEFIKTNVFQTTLEGLTQFWNFCQKYQPRAFGMEATGIYHHTIVKFLKTKQEEVKWGYRIVIYNPADAKAMPGTTQTDKLDSIMIAKYLAKNILRSGKDVIEKLEDLKAIFRMAEHIEKDRTALKNRIKKTLDRAGIRPRAFNLNSEWAVEFLHHFVNFEGPLGEFLKEITAKTSPLSAYRVYIKKHTNKFTPYEKISLTPAQRSLIRQDLIELDFKTGRKTVLAIDVDLLLQSQPILRKHAKNLASIPGISPFSSVWILAELGNINNFSTIRQFRAYCGCCPRVLSSGEKVYSVTTMKRSNAHLRTIFYNAAIVVCNLVKKESELKRYSTRVLNRKRDRSKKLAYCIVAGKIASIAYAILQNGRPFIPNYLDKAHFKHPSHSSDFTLTDKKLLRRARNTLKRVELIPKIGFLGEHARYLAEGLDQLLNGCNEKVFMV